MRNLQTRLTILFLALNALGALLGACGTVPGPTPGATPVSTVPTAPSDPTTPVPPDPTRPLPPVPTATPLPPCLDQAAFVSDVTIPDDTVVAPATAFVKTWRLLNAGTCTWTDQYALVFARGERMAGPAATPLPDTIAPGKSVDLTVNLTSPQDDGTYSGRWQLRNAKGNLFGIAGNEDGTFLVRIVVRSTPEPTPSPTPVVPPTEPVITEWRGEYYDTVDLGLSRLPVLVRNDKEIDFNWGSAAPAAGLPADAFSVRWTRRLGFEEATYRFHLRVDDGAILFIDDNIVIDAWKDGAVREVYAEYVMSSGKHDVRVEYYERGGQAQVHFWYEKVGPYMPDWKGEYWTNPNLSGSPVLVQNEGQVDFEWGSGSAAAGLPTDNWSARWTRTLFFPAGSYRFHVRVDDAARLYIDDNLVLDAWQDGNSREVTADATLSEGKHRVRLEFYERSGEARCRLWWDLLPPPSYSEWKGEYFANMDLRGNPRVVRNDEAVYFDWGGGAPAAGVPADKFSVRWSRWMYFAPGSYTLYAQADNGIRVYLDGRLVIDGWYSNGKEVFSFVATLGGYHHLVIEYYDNGGNALARFWWQ